MQSIRSIAIVVFLAAAATPCPVFAAATETFEFTVVGIDCKACAAPVLAALKGVDGVEDPKLDWKAGKATVRVEPGFDRTRIKKAIGQIGMEAVFPGETMRGLTPLPPEELAKLDIVSHDGKKAVPDGELLAPGKITLVDYWADWCSPCKLLEVRLQNLMKERPGFALRRVDVGNWDNAAAAQITNDFKAEALPYLRVYDASGKFVTAVTGGAWEQVLAAIDKASGAGGNEAGEDHHGHGEHGHDDEHGEHR